jgi:hypothetical protein
MNPQPNQHVSFGSTLASEISAAVYIRQRWEDEWTLAPTIACTRVHWAVSPNVGSATLERRFGPANERDGSLSIRLPIELGGWYIRVDVQCPDGLRKWHGFVVDVAEETSGVVTLLDPIATGQQQWACVGILAALDRDTIRRTIIRTKSPFEDDDFSRRNVSQSAPWFNPRARNASESSVEQIPNLCDVEDAPEIFLHAGYADTDTDVRFWKVSEILDYLIEHASPLDDTNEQVLPIRIENNSDAFGWPDENFELNCENKTLKRALDEIMHPGRGSGYWAWVDDSENEIVIEQFSTVTEDIIAFVQVMVPANEKQFNIYCSNDPSTKTTVQTVLTNRYNQVRCTGANRVVVFSASLDGLLRLTRGWTDAEVNAWLADFPIDDAVNPIEAEQQRRHALESGKYRYLFRRFLFDLDLRFFQNPIDATGFPFTSLFEPDPGEAYYIPLRSRIKLLRELPLKMGFDYSEPINTVVHRSTRSPYRSIAVYGRQHSLGGTVTDMNGPPNDWASRSNVDLFYHVGRPNYQIIPEPYDDGQNLGYLLHVSGGSQSILSDFGHPESFAFPHSPNIPPFSLTLTVAIEEDRLCEGVYPAVPSTDVDALLVKEIDLGPTFRLTQIKKGTIVGFDDENFITASEDYYIEDNRSNLEILAQMMYNWYAVPRSVLRLTSRRASAKLWPGQLINTINPGFGPQEKAVNSVITEISITIPLVESEQPVAPTFELVTGFGDIDVLQFRPRL